MTALDLYRSVINQKMTDYTECQSKQQYLDWVAKWKVQYNTLSHAIRKLKSMRKTTGNCYDPDAEWIKAMLRDRASFMLALRHEAKAWSIQQKNAKTDVAA